MSQDILELLNEAGRALRANLHRHDLDPTAHAHLERALSHVHEAGVATSDIGRARSVQRLVNDLEKVERLTVRLRRRQPGLLKSIRI